MNNQINKVEDAVAEYIIVLRDCLGNCKRSEDRTAYEKHLAWAGIMLAELHSGRSLDNLKKRIEAERRNFGWGYLSYEEGEAAEAAFAKLVGIVEDTD